MQGNKLFCDDKLFWRAPFQELMITSFKLYDVRARVHVYSVRQNFLSIWALVDYLF